MRSMRAATSTTAKTLATLGCASRRCAWSMCWASSSAHAKLLRRTFGVDVEAETWVYRQAWAHFQRTLGYFHIACQHPDKPHLVMSDSQSSPNWDLARKDGTIAAVHYLAPEEHWPWGGGTAFYRDHKHGQLEISHALCERLVAAADVANSTVLERGCASHIPPDSPQGRKAHELANQPHAPRTRTPMSDGDDEYELLRAIEYKPNRLVFYRAAQQHSAYLSEEVVSHLSCEPSKARLAVSMFLPGKVDEQWTPKRKPKRRKAAT